MWTGLDAELKVEKYGQKPYKNSWTTGVQKIREDEDYTSKYCNLGSGFVWFAFLVDCCQIWIGAY
jgi:hypothetical protein